MNQTAQLKPVTSRLFMQQENNMSRIRRFSLFAAFVALFAAGQPALAQDALLIVDVLTEYKTVAGLGIGKVKVERMLPTYQLYPETNFFAQLVPSNAVMRITAIPEPVVIGPDSFDSFVYVWEGDLPESMANRPPIHPVTFQLAMRNEDKEIALVLSREYHSGEGKGDLDLDGLPDVWELKYSLDPTSATGNNGKTGNPSGDELPGGWAPGSMNRYNPGDYPAALSGLTTNWPYRFPVTGVRPPNWYFGAVPFDNWLQARGFDGWYGLNPLTGINDDPGTDPNLLSTSGGTISDGWKYYFYGSLINDHTPPLEGVALDMASFDPNTSWDIPVLPILRATMLAVFGAELVADTSDDTDSDCATLADEFVEGTDPFHWDTDADEISDGYETKLDLNPVDPGDGDGNPSGDYMAFTDDGGERRHAQVYADLAYDPRTAWGENYLGRGPARELKGQENTISFTSREKFKASLYLAFIKGALNCGSFNSYALNPASIDTDGDGIFDGWELYVGLDPKNKDDAGVDGDDDGLTSFQEFSAYDINLLRGATWPNGRTHFDAAWINKVWPSDPNVEDTDGDGLVDGAEGGYKNLDVAEGEETSGSLAVLKYAGGTIEWNNSCYVGGGLNPTTVDTDGEGIPDPWEAWAPHISKVFSIADQDDRNGMDGTVKDSGRDYDGDGLVNYQEYVSGAVHHWRYDEWTPGLPLGSYDPFLYFTGVPYAWDWHTLVNKVPLQFIPKYNGNTKVFYSSTNPRLVDTDYDGMDDYWEMYHGLNPLYGTLDMYQSMLMDVRNLLAGVPPTFDIRVQPFVAGSQFADPDQDGLPNSDESIQANAAAPNYYHTSPAPLWVTDTSYQLSWVNLYYGLGSLLSHWYFGSALLPPSYLFSFASNEGFDTDSDMLGDRAELVHTPTSPGSTDPLSVESPPRRRALHLDGAGAARTRGQFLHPNYDLTSFTIEAWVKPSRPAKGEMQVILERPMHVPNGNIMGYPEGNRRNFRLALDADGRPLVAYNGLGYDALYVEAKAPSAFALQTNEWVHLAGVYDGAAGRLYLYIDGEMRASVASAERPANGWYTGNPAFVFSAPIVLGAADNNPDGWVSGMPILVGTGAGTVLTQPDLSNFFEGWADEVRIWSGARSAAQILEGRMKKMTIANVVSSRADAVSTNAGPNLMYLYNFDNLLDPVLEGVAPAGFEFLNGRPNDGSYPHVPWWGTAADHSTAYDNYLYVPWIANIAARYPLDPPADSPYNQMMVTNISTNVTTSSDTTTNGTNVVTTTTTTTNVTTEVVQARNFPNSANPYNMGYYHGASALLENHPDELNLAHLVFDTRESSLFNDLLPLRSARVDAGVELWDGAGNGLEPFDSNGDGIPDWWYLENGFDPRGTSIAEEDPDGDGLSNYWEYRLGSDPFSTYSLDSRVSDADYDSDGDTLTNLDEIQNYGTDPDHADTDDDTHPDNEEVMQNTSGLYSRSPLTGRSLVLTGAPFTVPEPKALIEGVAGPERFQALDRWYLAAMVQPAAAQTGALIRRNVTSGEIHFELGLDNNVPFVRFNNLHGATFTASGTAPLPTDRFSALIADWNPSNHVLRLLVDDCVVGAVNVASACIKGQGRTVIGDGVHGRIDDVYIGRNLLGGEAVAPDYVLMIDVSGSMAAESRMDQAKAAAQTAISAMPQGASMAIVTFDHEVQQVQEFTTDRGVLTAFVAALTPLGATSYSAPVSKMIELIAGRVSPSGYVGILISDGIPNSGVPTDLDLADVVALGGRINTVGFGSSILSGNTYELQRIAQLTGGTFFPAPSGDELEGILTALVSEEGFDESCFYPFDDGGLHAEDYRHARDPDYVLTGVTFDDLVYSTVITPFNYAFQDFEDDPPQWWVDWFLKDSEAAEVDDDPDGDGLSNLNEWRISYRNQSLGLSALNPVLFDSNGNGAGDGDEDHDGDTLIGRDEQGTHESRPDRLDTDDDGLNDNQELGGATDPAYSMMPYTMRALRFGAMGGTGEALVEDRVRGVDTEHLGATNWTVECYVQPEAVPPVGVDQPLIRRHLRCGDLINYELGIRNDGSGRIAPYVRYNHFNDANLTDLSTSNALPVSQWTHLAGRLDNGRISLFVDGQEVRSLNTSYDPARGPGDVYFGGNGFVGRLKETRIWKIARRDTDIRDFRNRSLVFDAQAADPGLLRVVGDSGHLREVAAPGTARDQLREWTLECWVRTTDTDGTVISRVNGGNVLEDTDDFNYAIRVGQGGRLVGQFSIQWRDVTANTNGTSTAGDVIINTTVNTMVSALPVNDGVWHHVAYTRDANTAVLYIDGELSAIQNGLLVPTSISPLVTDVDLRILDGPVEIGRNLAGSIDEVRIWNRLLSAEEIRSMMKQNLFGNENGLITYFSFDFQQGNVAEDRAAVRNPSMEYGTYIPGAQHVRTADQAPLDDFYPLRVYAFTALLGYYPADDGGDTLENLLYQNNWDYAGRLSGDVMFETLSSTNKPYADDSDGDGLPDWWETLMGLNPGNDRDADGAYGDPDHDGLTNLGEFLAGTNPNQWDTDGDGVNDFNSSAGGLTFGEFYMDGDMIPDAWEVFFPGFLSPLVNDAHTDPDGDGWGSLAEYLGNGFDAMVAEGSTTAVYTATAPTRPSDPNSWPVPEIRFTFLGETAAALSSELDEGKLASDDLVTTSGEAAGLVVWAFSDPLMRQPDAKALIPFSGPFANGSTSTVVRWATGHLRQGSNIFMAFIDANKDGIWNAGEWLGFSENGTENIQWGSADVRIGLTDKPAGYIRFSWAQDMAKISAGLSQVNGTTYLVAIKSLGQSGQPVIYSTTRDLESMDRAYITEMDLKQAGVAPLYGAYEWSVGTVDGTAYAKGTNSILYSASLATPAIQYPVNTTLQHAQNSIRFTLSPDAAQIKIQIQRSGATVYSATLPAPYVGNSGVAEIKLPWLAGWGSLTNGNYNLLLSAHNPRVGSSTNTAAFSVNLQPAPVGAGMIAGQLRYFGTNTGVYVVEAFAGAGFDQTPAARVKAAADGSYAVLGLRAGSYHIRGFVDKNANAVLDAGEPWGFVKGQPNSSIVLSRKKASSRKSSGSQLAYAVEYTVYSIEVAEQGKVMGKDLIAYDSIAYRKTNADSDRDGLTDDVELALGTNPVRWDSDFDGLSDEAELVTYLTDPLNPDTDGDGMPDGWEQAQGFNPLSPADGALDPDHDELSNSDEYRQGTDLNDADSDNDGLLDGWEVRYALNPLGTSGVDGASGDPDGDTVPNLQEQQLGTNPRVADTDLDGLDDGQEVTLTTDPLDWDTDDDGYSDGTEVAAGTDPKRVLDHPLSGFSAQTRFIDIQPASGGATVVYTATDLVGSLVTLDFQENDDLTNGAAWTPVGVQRTITAAGTYTNVVPDPDADGILNLRIESK